MKTTAMKKIAGKNPADPVLNRRAFTLIELLTVITIIAVLAAFTVPVLTSLKRREYISKTQAELAQLATAIDSYKAVYGFYPPGNANAVNNLKSAMTNQLYFELLGTTNLDTSSGMFLTLDASAKISAADAGSTFGVGGFMNSSKPNGEESSQQARSFLSGLKPNQSVILLTNAPDIIIKILVGSVGGPDQKYQPLGVSDVNPWRYVSPGVNNPNGYDLYIQLVIGGKTNLVCNWSKQVQINSPLP
jgi:prepilin-type N-terminal cleavage/methylation domain-containing protein